MGVRIGEVQVVTLVGVEVGWVVDMREGGREEVMEGAMEGLMEGLEKGINLWSVDSLPCMDEKHSTLTASNRAMH